jgi:hypothetical protein
MAVITSNPVLTGVGTVVELNTKYLNTVDLVIEDNGGGSTITVESSADDATWATMATGVYNMTTGALVATAGTLTAKGKYVIDASAINYVRIRVSTYVSGTIIARFEESPVSLKGLYNTMLYTGLVAQGTTQASALPINGTFNVFSTVAASACAILPAALNKNAEVALRNFGANALTVYAPAGGTINGGAVNGTHSVPAGNSARYITDGVGNYWTL